MTVRFPDLNTWHRVNDWPAFRRAYPIAACRATMGTGEVDGYWFDFVAGCRNYDVLPIGYHRLRPDMDPVRQVAHYLRIVGPSVAFALDVETTQGAPDPDMVDAGHFVDELARVTGRDRSHVLSYLPRWWYDAHGGGRRDLQGTRLWASRYKTPIDWQPYAGFPAIEIMQFSDEWPITGVGLGDMNEYRGSLDELKVLLGFKLDTADKQWIEGALA